jgi:hypothetical protein
MTKGAARWSEIEETEKKETYVAHIQELPEKHGGGVGRERLRESPSARWKNPQRLTQPVVVL